MHPYVRHSKTNISILTGLLLLCFVVRGGAQLSPGELTRAHAHLEGIRNCTKCHTLGDKVSNDKCLECHKEIKSRMDLKKGYHVSAEVAGKDCFSCHSDHHGRNFEIIRFDENRFNHELTGYKLTGAHRQLECKSCHNRDLIESPDLKQKKNTYLGLKTDCKSCHQDVHQGTLSTNCVSCHNTDAFSPAALFDHAKTDFPLKGRHRNVDCRQCHEVTNTNNISFQRFAGVPFNSCADCHIDVHNRQFGQNCKECHTEESFSAFAGKSSFNHNQTGFPLLGKHRNINCTSCHQVGGNVQAASVFKDFKGKDIQNCVTCHADVHENRFGPDCRSCHSEESFQKLLHPETFQHDLTGYPLEGKHRTVDCRKCHEGTKTDPLPHQQCVDCHADFHKGQFIRDAYRPDCRECHTVSGFAGSSYTIEKHNEGMFPLTGAHLATPCFACHQKNDEWQFKNIGQLCVDCHADVHDGFLNPTFYPGKACEKCHSPEGWAQTSFDHLLTGFELLGKHKSTACTSCHKPDPGNSHVAIIPFTGLLRECISCHDNIHDRQFEVEGATDCRRCHDFEAWRPSLFDHNQARFVLEGAHKSVDCRKCHKPEVVDGRTVIKYRLEQFECASCHVN